MSWLRCFLDQQGVLHSPGMQADACNTGGGVPSCELSRCCLCSTYVHAAKHGTNFIHLDVTPYSTSRVLAEVWCQCTQLLMLSQVVWSGLQVLC